MRKSGYFLLFLALTVYCTAIAQDDWQTKAANPDFLHRTVKTVTDVIVYDIYSPPVASRTYAYVCTAGSETLSGSVAFDAVFNKELQGIEAFPLKKSETPICEQLAAVNAMLLVAKPLVISESKIEDFRQKILKELKATGMPEEMYLSSLAYGQQVAERILAWAGKDNYKQTRSLPRYFVDKDKSSWKPTAPTFMKAIEPHWSKMRPFLIDSAGQFIPVPPTVFSAEKESQFYKEAFELYSKTKQLTTEETQIANFWDCNPFEMNIRGHVMFATKKISPGGHWINITALACKKNKLSFAESLRVYSAVSVTIADAFISCWEEKYRSNAIRPETYINNYIDKTWLPILQTPPFPEYTSGHSVISGASAVVLTHFFGENFAYADSTELEFGIPVRNYTSFLQAASEAAISRYYGGIHFVPSLENGLEQGKAVGEFSTQFIDVKAFNATDYLLRRK